jgi:hypothetical protein
MFGYDWFGFILVFVFGLIICVAAVSSQFPKRVRQILMFGFIVHAFGSIVRFIVLYGYYDGGDAGRYYRYGLKYARMLWSLDFSIFEPAHMELSRWWGTQTTMWISGLVITFIGPSKTGGFLFFGILAFIALALFCKVFEKNFPNSDLKKYMAWLLFWPSLWFWPSSIGKDALVLLATALVIYGFTRKTSGIKWGSLVLGIALAGIIRPQVAGILIVSVGVAHWISPGRQWGAVHYFQGLLLLIVLSLVVRHGLSSVGIEEFDIDDFQGYVEHVSQQSSVGGSAIGTPGFTALGIPLAIVNILFRPFPWESGNPLSAAASLEMVVFWSLIFLRRRRIIALAAQWRTHKLLRLAVPLTFLYVIALGMAAGNLGIIARQRIHVMPLLFIWLEAIPVQLDRKIKRSPTRLKEIRYIPATIGGNKTGDIQQN